MKKSISNRDVARIAAHAGLGIQQVRAALSLNENQPATVIERVTKSLKALNYSVTNRDRVAMAAGTSIATVNRAYRPDVRKLVRPSLLEAIEREANRLGYVPDPVARVRRTLSTQLVALCPPLCRLSEPETSLLVQALAADVSARGWHPFIAPIPDGKLLPDLAQSAATRVVILFSGPDTDRQALALKASGRATVVVGAHPTLNGVTPDWIAGFKALTHYTLSRGFDTIHLGYYQPGRWTLGLQLEGVAQALEELDGPAPRVRMLAQEGLSVTEASTGLQRAGMKAAARLIAGLAGEPDSWRVAPRASGEEVLTEIQRELEALVASGRRAAVLGRCDMTARRLVHRLASARPEWSLGGHYGVAGYGNLEPSLGFVHPILTSLAVNVADMARAIINRAVEIVEGAEVVISAPVAARLVARVSL